MLKQKKNQKQKKTQQSIVKVLIFKISSNQNELFFDLSVQKIYINFFKYGVCVQLSIDHI